MEQRDNYSHLKNFVKTISAYNSKSTSVHFTKIIRKNREREFSAILLLSFQFFFFSTYFSLILSYMIRRFVSMYLSFDDFLHPRFESLH